MKTLTIDRNKWVRGSLGNYGPSKMLNSLGNKCCLGHFGTQILGWSDDTMRGKSFPSNCTVDVTPLTKESDFFDIIVNTSFSDAAARYNDYLYLTESQREEKLIKLFAENGYELSFYN